MPTADMPRPLALTDEQLDLLHRMAWPLSPTDRGSFLELVAERLRGQAELGDGVVHRIAVECQRAFWSPPDLSVGAPGRNSKYR